LKQLYNITIKEDFPDKIVEKRKLLEPLSRFANQQGYKANVVTDKLIVNNKVYTTDTIDRLPEKLQPQNVFTLQKGKTTAFFSKHSPLSNFSHSPFTVKNINYNCNEQFFTHQKALRFNDYETAEKILRETDPVKIKRLGKNIKGFDSKIWRECCNEIMKTGLLNKFDQNETHRKFLLNTGDNTLIEASPTDTYWGTGKSLWDKNLFQSSSWIANAKNMLGNLLTEVRREIRNTHQN
jgi:ribA/ribD-fused uncharacterized protein